MKKIKMIMTTGAFALALVFSFAFKPNSANFATAYIKGPLNDCITQVSCNGGSTLCKINGITQAYLDRAVCATPAFQH
jgi:hypothetical protein